MQRVQLGAQQVQRSDADLQVLAHRTFVERIRRTRQLDFAVQRLVGYAQQGAVRHTQAITLSGDGAAFHVDRHCARQVDQRTFLRPAQFPVTVVIGQHRAGAQALLELFAAFAGNLRSRLLQGQLHFGQGRNRDMRRQHTVENPVTTHVGVGQHVIADGLRLTQATAVTDHQPAMRTQYSEVIGDVLGIGRADADVDQRHAMTVFGDQVVGRHLIAVPDHAGDDGLGFVLAHALVDYHVTRQDHAHETRVFAKLFQAVQNELVDIAVIVGQQNPRLYVAPVAAGVMHQTAQREIHPRSVEQRQWQRVDVGPVIQAVGNAIGGGRQVGAREHPCQRRSGDARAGQLIALLDHVRIRNALLAHADFDRHGEIVHQRNELFEQVLFEGFGLRDGNAVGARQLHLGVGTGGHRYFALAFVDQAQFRVAELRALFGGGFDAVFQVALERLTQRTGSAFMQLGEPFYSLLGGVDNNKGLGHDSCPV